MHMGVAVVGYLVLSVILSVLVGRLLRGRCEQYREASPLKAVDRLGRFSGNSASASTSAIGGFKWRGGLRRS
ncbi:hypothetical protein LMIY3S_01531 [Labrys miyagiensis]